MNKNEVEKLAVSIYEFSRMPITKEFNILNIPFYRVFEKRRIEAELRLLYIFLAQIAIKQTLKNSSELILDRFAELFKEAYKEEPTKRVVVVEKWAQYASLLQSELERDFVKIVRVIVPTYPSEVQKNFAVYLQHVYMSMKQYYGRPEDIIRSLGYKLDSSD